jgi:pilus assembly protein Flp/PilA
MTGLVGMGEVDRSSKEELMLELVTQALRAAWNREEGQAMVEYALILGLISVVAIAVLTLIGQDVNGIFTAVEGALSAVPGA